MTDVCETSVKDCVRTTIKVNRLAESGCMFSPQNPEKNPHFLQVKTERSMITNHDA